MSGFIVVNGTQSMGKLLREIQLRDYKSSLILNKFLSLSRFGDTSASGCRIKGNPVRNRNSARYCKATLLRLLIAATEHTENILQNNATVLQTAVGESEHQLSHRRPGMGRCGFP